MAEHLGVLLFTISIVLLLVALVLGRSSPSAGKSARSENGSLTLNAAAGTPRTTAITLWARIGVTTLLLAAALFIILSRRYQADEQKWAYGVIGTIIGYWLKG